MSLVRTAMRLAVVEAMAPSGTPEDGSWPTIARGRFYDSCFAPIDDLSEEERRTIVQVYTDETEAVPRNPTGGTSYRSSIDIRFELSVPQIVKANLDGEDTILIDHPETDEVTEAALDLLEAQILFVLHRGPTGRLFRNVFGIRFARVHSEPLRSAEEKVRLGMRTLTLRVTDVTDDCYDPTPATALTGIDRLPEPLRTVAQQLPVGSPGRRIAETLAGDAPVMPPRVPLNQITLNLDVANQRGEVDGEADVTATVPLSE